MNSSACEATRWHKKKMTWERRAGTTKRYYLRSRKVAGVVVKTYVGRASDPVVGLLARGDSLSRAEASAAVAEVRFEQAAHGDLEPVLEDLANRVQEAHRVALLACGYRRTRGKLQAVKYRNTTIPRSDVASGTEPVTRELVDHLARRANYGDGQAADRLRQIIRANPEVWQDVGDLAKHAERCLIELIARGNVVLEESVRLQVDKLRKSLLAEATSTILERLLIEHVVVSWLEVEFTRIAALQPQQFKQDARVWAQAHERADARFKSAIRELATVRGLLGHGTAVVPFPEHVDKDGREAAGPILGDRGLTCCPGRRQIPNRPAITDWTPGGPPAQSKPKSLATRGGAGRQRR